MFEKEESEHWALIFFVPGLFLDMFFGKKPPPAATAGGKPAGKSKWLATKENVWTVAASNADPEREPSLLLFQFDLKKKIMLRSLS